MNIIVKATIMSVIGILLFQGCEMGEEEATDIDANSALDCINTSIDADVPAWIQVNFTCIEASMDGNSTIVIKTNNVPPHNSYYFGEVSDNYEPLPSDNHPNPNLIQAQNYVFTISADPTERSTITPTTFDAIGVAIDGVVYFNNEAAPGDDLAQEIGTFDSANSHPTHNGIYHYHIEPIAITNNDSTLIGILLDGFPVYGKKDEDGTTPSDLDEAHGHNHATSHFPDGIYHYHVTDEDPYISDGYRGTPGSFTNNP